MRGFTMEKIYTYENAKVTINISEQHDVMTIKKATQEFLLKALKEKIDNVNRNKSSNLRKK